MLQSLFDGTFYTGFTKNLQRRPEAHCPKHTFKTAILKPCK
ncbi:MAG: hypothetical protein HYV28_07735 [Ignavibacteriales bacterium]|nr:hypothetical protein [Ignavibacteriales bacterium]